MPIDYKKILRLFVSAFMFLCVTTIIGLNMRAGHQLLFALGVIILFALLVKNIWLTLFMWLSCLLFTIYKFEFGQVYITNIFYGAILFYITKIAFEKQHIDWFIKIFLWLVVANLGYSILQVLNFDFIYRFSENLYIPFLSFAKIPSPNGFMGNSGITGCLYAFAVPLIARKSIWLAVAMLIPIFILRAFAALTGGFVALLFVMWFRVDRKIWIASLMGVLVASGAYLAYFDMPGLERVHLWKMALSDAKCHPIKGFGMDSFRKITSSKNFDYQQGEVNPSLWDNPHNLLVSLFFEFGFLVFLILGGYIRHLILLFNRSLNTIALAGFIVCFFVVSMGSFLAFLCRTMVIIIPMFALYEISAVR